MSERWHRCSFPFEPPLTFEPREDGLKSVSLCHQQTPPPPMSPMCHQSGQTHRSIDRFPSVVTMPTGWPLVFIRVHQSRGSVGKRWFPWGLTLRLSTPHSHCGEGWGGGVISLCVVWTNYTHLEPKWRVLPPLVLEPVLSVPTRWWAVSPGRLCF